MHLQGRRIIVTGGAQGMGEATVRAYVREGAQVVTMDVRDEQGEEIARTATGAGPGKAVYRHVDVSSRDEVFAAVGEGADLLGGLDVLVNVAGVQRAKPAHELSDADLDFLLGINLRGTIYTNQAAYGVMHGQELGTILNFGSDAGLTGIKGLAGYSASKGGIMAWTRTVAAEWGRQGIRVNSVMPAVQTPMTSAGRAERGKLYDSGPLGGLGDPDRDFAPVMVFLASEGARFITGQIIAVNGGLGMVR
ncbi:SDR family oxidoreductase [Arthrobacter crystallopoietes]|uniref:SDR family NAD(P)-dependent oxidoreductase n=1 Tax=Crystallibacter crystallopoietes TaxID=37928 RepID=UPI003D221EBC